MSQTFQATFNFSHTWLRPLIWSMLWGSLHSCLRPFTEDKARLSFQWLRPRKESVGGGVRASEDDFQFMRDDRIQETNVPGSILRLDNAEKNILYISQRLLYKQHLCVAGKVTLKASFVGFPNSLSHSPVTYFLWSSFKPYTSIRVPFSCSAFVNPRVGQLPLNECATQNKVKCTSHNYQLFFSLNNCNRYHRCMLAFWGSWIAFKNLREDVDLLHR